MTDALISLNNVSACYGQRRVLDHIRLDIQQGEMVILRGPNGGGKTTLLRLIAGLVRPAGGHIDRQEGLRIGYLPQYRSIDRDFPVTVSQAVMGGLLEGWRLWQRPSASDKARATALMDRLHITALADRPIASLSGGQWQRVLLARALAGGPDILLLDEPDTHLDSVSRHDLYTFIQHECRRCTIIMVSHDRDVTTLFPDARVIIIENGKTTPTESARQDESNSYTEML